MFPRRSTVTRVLLAAAGFFLLGFLWVSSPQRSDRGLLRRLFAAEPINSTALRLELADLHARMNFTDTEFLRRNHTDEELYDYVVHLREKLPVNPHNFNYIINPKNVCVGADVFIISYIHSAPDHYKRRMTIRETWGNRKNFKEGYFRLVFLVGRPKENSVQDALLMESDTYGDIVQEDFMDAYKNLTYKGIMGLKWVSQFCSHAKFVLKSDDDIFVNIFNVASHLESVARKSPGRAVRNLLLCLVWYRMKVVRDTKSKWYLSRAEFREDYFPTYCSGSAFMLTPDVAAVMYEASLTTPFFWVDDFYVTGLLAKKVGVTHSKFNSVYTLGPSTFLEKFTEEGKWRTLTFGHVHNINHLTRVWTKVLEDRKIHPLRNINDTGIAKFIPR